MFRRGVEEHERVSMGMLETEHGLFEREKESVLHFDYKVSYYYVVQEAFGWMTKIHVFFYPCNLFSPASTNNGAYLLGSSSDIITSAERLGRPSKQSFHRGLTMARCQRK